MTEKGTSDKKHLHSSILFCLIIFYFLLFHSEAAGSVVGEIEISGLHSMEREELLYLLDIFPGVTIDASHVRFGIKRAFIKGIFEDISVETVNGEKTKVIINVKERKYINRIYVKGDSALSKKTIKNLFLLKEEAILVCDMIEKAEEELKQALTVRGFPNVKIHAEIKKIKKPNLIDIHLHVNTGVPETIKKIYISGVQKEEIQKIMKLSEGDVFDQLRLRKDLSRIKSHYKKNGYFKPVIEHHVLKDGILDIKISPGKQLEISFKGNDVISDKNLFKEMPFFDAEDFNDDIVEEASHRLLSLYHSEGYPFAQIAPVVTSQDNLISLNFFIFEGSRVKIQEISFTGNSLSEKSLEEMMSLKEGNFYNPELLDSDREALKEFYTAFGYLSADIEEFETRYGEDTHKMDITVKITEGVKTEIEDIRIAGINYLSKAEIRTAIKIKQGDAYNEVDISDARYRVIELYNTKGFQEVNVRVKREFKGQKASVTFHINEGSQIFFGKTIVTGNYKTKYTVIQRELQQKEGMPFDYSLTTKERQGLYKLGLFTDIDMQILDRYDHTKDIVMSVREGNAGAFEFGLGYSDYEKQRGFLDIGYRNLWGMNRQASVRFELSTLEKRFILQYYEPWFLSRSIPFRSFLLRESKREINIDTRETRYRLTRNTATAGLEKKFSTNIKSEFYYEVSQVKTYDVQSDVILSKEDTGTLLISGIRPGLIYDTRNNPFYPSKGTLSGISLKFTSPFFFSETDFLKLTFYFNFYQKATRAIVFAASFRGGVAQGYNKTEELPLVERFFLGGRTTVRGYNQDNLGPKGSDGTPTGGNAFLMESLEIRTSVTKSMGIVLFLDGGNVWLKTNDIDISDFKFTTGIGLRYKTPVGPIRLDYGHKLQREKGESRGELHFSIGHAF